MTSLAPMRLQSLIWPEESLNTERDLYLRLDGAAALSMRKQRVQFIPGSLADFCTYYNLFNTGKWVKHCDLETLELELHGEGHFELTVFHVRPERSAERVITDIITLEKGVPKTFNIVPQNGFNTLGLVFFQMIALSAGHLDNAHWQTTDAPKRIPKLMLSVTTFRREEAVKNTVARFEKFVASSDIAEHLHLTVVDNGQTAEVTNSANVSTIPNANLGGSGGFTRGLLEAQKRSASHCLFMDDDASVHMDAITRTWMFLAYAKNPDTAIAGAVANAQYRWQLWENGALFNRVCMPQHMGLDLREADEVISMEFDSTPKRPDNFYGGWWYFAFPVERVQHMPFPFFVRGDDVSFSLVHDFNIVTLPGVMSYQDEDFSVKETPLTVYLDLRSHMAHHLSLPSMEIGRLGMMKIIARFYLRSFLFCHYDTLEAIGLALDDVLEGPAYFAANSDMSTRRKQIGELTDEERWRPVNETATKALRHKINPHHRLHRLFMKLTLNGHLLPGFSTIGNRIKMGADTRGQLRHVWGASEITYVSADRLRSYTVQHSKKRAAKTSLPIMRAAWKMWWSYKTVRDEWHKGYDTMTKEGFWRKQLDMEEPVSPPPS